MEKDKNELTILHLSDLHFRSGTVTDEYRRETVLESIIEKVSTYGQSWNPDIIVVAGDIAWSGKASEYDKAKSFFLKLEEKFNLTPDRFIVCPGNHDIDLEEARDLVLCTGSEKSCDRLKYENVFNKLALPFKNYEKFCDSLCFEKLNVITQESHLSGYRTLLGLDFIVLNSSWYVREDSKKICIGLPQIECLKHKGFLKDEKNYNSSNITIAVVHHPKDCLCEFDIRPYYDKPAAYQLLAKGCHMILSGHTHSQHCETDQIFEHARLFVNGATYENSRYINGFMLYKINKQKRSVDCKFLEYHSSRGEWDEVTSLNKTYNLIKGSYKLTTAENAAELSAAKTDSYYDRMQDLKFNLIKIYNENDFKNIRNVIWPVVPRPRVNIIHKGQIEIIKMLAQNGAKVSILVSDYAIVSTNVDVDSFKKSLNEYLERNGIKEFEIIQLSELIKLNNSMVENFISLSEKFTVNELVTIRQKGFKQEDKEKIPNETVLKNIRPLLSSAGVLMIISQRKDSGRCVVIAGEDEYALWSTIIKRYEIDFSIIFNPTLEYDKSTVNQDREQLVFVGMEDLREFMNNINTCEWIYKMFVYLQNENEQIGEFKDGVSTSFDSEDGIKRMPDWINKEKFIKYIFDKVKV